MSVCGLKRLPSACLTAYLWAGVKWHRQIALLHSLHAAKSYPGPTISIRTINSVTRYRTVRDFLFPVTWCERTLITALYIHAECVLHIRHQAIFVGRNDFERVLWSERWRGAFLKTSTTSRLGTHRQGREIRLYATVDPHHITRPFPFFNYTRGHASRSEVQTQEFYFLPLFKWSTFFSLYEKLTDDHKHLTRLVLNFIGGVESRELSATLLQGSVCEAIKSLAGLAL